MPPGGAAGCAGPPPPPPVVPPPVPRRRRRLYRRRCRRSSLKSTVPLPPLVDVLKVPVIVPVVRPGIGKSELVGFGTAKVLCLPTVEGLDLEVKVDTDEFERTCPAR